MPVISEGTGVTLGVLWTLLIGIVAAAGVAISVKLDLQAMQIQARHDRAVLHLIAKKVGVEIPSDDP